MLGGKEEPCVSLVSIRAMQAQGRLCPRVELDTDNRTAGELALAAIRVGADNPLWSRLFELHTDGATPEERVELLWRVLYACGSDGVDARVKRMRERGKDGG